MLASAVQLANALPGISIDAQVSRQVSVGLSIVQRARGGRRLRPVAGVSRSAPNGAFTSQQMRQLISAVGPHRDLVLVNTYEARSWEAGVNRVIAAAARRYPHVAMANWFATIEPPDHACYGGRGPPAAQRGTALRADGRHGGPGRPDSRHGRAPARCRPPRTASHPLADRPARLV